MANLEVDLPPEHAKAIGYVAAYSSLLESVAQESIWRLLGINEKAGRAVTSELMLSGIMNMLLTVAQEKIDDENLIGELKAFHKKTLDKDASREDRESLNKRRNRVIHCQWRVGLVDALIGGMGERETRTATNYRARGRVTSDFKSMWDHDISDIAASFAHMTALLDDWTIRAIEYLNSKNHEASGAP